MAKICCIFFGCLRFVTGAAAGVFVLLVCQDSRDPEYWLGLVAAGAGYLVATLAHVRSRRWADRERPGEQCLLRHFAAVCGAWVGCLVCFPHLCRGLDTWVFTFLLVLANLSLSIRELVRYRRVSRLLVFLPLPLFWVLHAQTAAVPCLNRVPNYVMAGAADGPDSQPQPVRPSGFSRGGFDPEAMQPGWWAWGKFTVIQFLRAADILDALELWWERSEIDVSGASVQARLEAFLHRILDEYTADSRDASCAPSRESTRSMVGAGHARRKIQGITPHSWLARCLVVFMHLNVDLFVGGAVWVAVGRMLRGRAERLHKHARAAGRPSDAEKRARGVRVAYAAAACLTLVGLAAYLQRWPADQLLLWLLENFLKPLDIGDLMQVFEIRLHSLRRNTANGLVALCFRLLIASTSVALLYAVRILVFGDVGMSVYELAGMLDSRFKAVRRRAARSLAGIPVAKDAGDVLPSLHAALWSSDPLVLVPVLTLLERIGPPAFDSAMGALVQHESSLVGGAASRCLAKMGEDALEPLKKVVLGSSDLQLVIRGIHTLELLAVGDRTLVARIQAVLASVESRDEEVRIAVATALAKLDGSAA